MNNDRTKKLGEGLSNRHITMISIGGVIGAGLFVGSSSAIAKVSTPCSDSCIPDYQHYGFSGDAHVR